MKNNLNANFFKTYFVMIIFIRKAKIQYVKKFISVGVG